MDEKRAHDPTILHWFGREMHATDPKCGAPREEPGIGCLAVSFVAKADTIADALGFHTCDACYRLAKSARVMRRIADLRRGLRGVA